MSSSKPRWLHVALTTAFLPLPAISQVAPQVAPKEPQTIVTPAPGQTAAPVVTPPSPVEVPDTTGALWVAAASGNFAVANRPVDQAIDMVVIHDIEGSAEGCVSWFQNPRARVSSHYVVSSTTSQVWQMVKERDVAWHAGNSSINRRSIGLEHEGYAYRPGFYNTIEYEASAKLVRSITTRYNIPRDRTHIIAHAEVPHPTKPGLFGGASGHTDPGPYWDWDTFMTLIRNDGRLLERNFPSVIHPGELIEVSAHFENLGDDAWPALRGGKRDPAVQERGAVYLGTWEPAGRSSAFFNYKFWTSPRLASEPVEGEVAPGARGRFAFSLLGPRTLGEVKEQFRLVKVPVAPKSPVSFGEVLTAVIRVEPWEIIKDTSAKEFSAPEWQKNGQMHSRKTVPMTVTAAPAEWKVDLPIDGEWDIYARWPRGKRHSSKASYQIETAGKVYTTSVNQRTGSDWFKLGRYPVAKAKTVNVRLLTHSGRGVVVADAIRLVGPFPSQ